MTKQIDTTAVINSVRLAEQAVSPSTPSSGYSNLYIKSDGLYYINSGGSVVGPLFSALPPKKNIAITDSPYTMLSTDYTLRCNANGGSIIIILPVAVGSGRICNIKNLYTSTCIVQVVADTTGTPDLIDGQTTQSLSVRSNLEIQDGEINFWDIL